MHSASKFISDYKHIFILVIIASLLTVGGIYAIDRFRTTLRNGQITDFVIQANTAIKNQDYQTAFAFLIKAQQLDPTDLDIYFRQANVAFLSGDYPLAFSLYVKAQKTNIAAQTYYDILTKISNFNFDKALLLISDNLSLFTSDSIPTLEVVTNLKKQIESIENTANEPLRKAQIAKILIDEKALNLAEPILTQMIIDYPYYRDAYYLLGITYLMQGKSELAKENFQQSLVIDPNYAPALSYLDKL